MNELNGRTLFSGDQNGLGWDVPLKLAVLFDHGLLVEHSLHTTDLFSRPDEMGTELVEVTREAYVPGGNVNRWTASLEAAPFLGQMPISPAAFTGRGLDLKRVATFQNRSLYEVVTTLTKGEWLGLSRREEGKIAHDICVRDFIPRFPAMRKPLRANLSESVEACNQRTALEAFDQLFNFNEDSTLAWPVAAQRVLREALDRYGVRSGITLTTTLDTFTRGKGAIRSLFLPIFLDQYRIVRSAYNEAIAGPGEIMIPLQDGDLPFYAVIRVVGDRLKRIDLQYEPGDTVSRLLARTATQGEVVAIVGKAIPHLIELLMEGSIVMCDAASAYTPRVARFAQLLETRYGIQLDLKPVVRVRLNALDALAEVSHRFLLPEYLQAPFQTKWISGVEFASKWKQVVHEAEVNLGILSEKEIIMFLRDQGILSNRLCGVVDSLQSLIAMCGKERAASKRSQQDNLNFFKRALETVLDGVEDERAKMMRKLLAVTISLPYWNCRPFAHWVDALPGWSDAIRKKAEIVVEPLF